MRPFNSVEEADDYICRSVMVEDSRARVIEIKLKNDSLYFTFEYEDGTTEVLDSETAFESVKIDGHAFGIEL